MSNTILDEIIEGLQERSGDIFYDFHELGDVDENGKPIDPADTNAGPGRFQSSIEKLCVAAEGAEGILRALKTRPELACQLFTEKNEPKITAEHSLPFQGESESTPGSWTEESPPDTEGDYNTKDANHEQDTWVADGYNISEEEGDWRHLLVERRDTNMARFIPIAELFKTLISGMCCSFWIQKENSPSDSPTPSFEPADSHHCQPESEVEMNSRTQTAETILNEYCRLKGESLDCHDAGITDLMTDLMHLARKNDLDGFKLSRMAQMHFLVEKETGS